MGWVLHRGAATVTGIFRTLGSLADRPGTIYHKFFCRGAWTLEELSALRRVLWPHRISSNSTLTGRVRRILEPLTQALFSAA